jgi:putative DNA primase/helicase
MASSLDAVISQMCALGMPDISAHELQLNTGRWVRYGPRKKAYYRIDERVSRAGRAYFVGAFGFKGNGPYLVEYQGETLSPDEIRRLEEARRIAAERDAKLRSREIQLAADRAADTWRDASPTGSSPYLQRKGVEISGGWVRYLGPNVVVPMVRYDLPEGERIKGVQIIRPDGEKRFTAGMEKKGTAAVIGLHADRDPILICEGLATAASCWLSMSRIYRVVVAFDAGNLLPVAEIIRSQHPHAPILICADDDYLTEGNPGRVKAVAAATQVDGRVVYPIFRSRGGAKLTDFNDLHVTEGLPEVTEQLVSACQWLHRL